jgi:hypothetical protein
LTTLYWQAPFWQVVVAGSAVLVAFVLLALRAYRQPRLHETVQQVEPRLAGEAIFYFEPAEGLRGITPAAVELLRDPLARHRLTEVLAAAHDAGTFQREADWPRPGASLLAIPVGDDRQQSRGVVAVLGNDALGPVIGGEASEELGWIGVGPDIRVHRARPIVRVRRAGGDGSSGWQDAALTPTEDILLRTLLASPGSILTPDELFRAVWPDDPVSRHGLRPEQRDRVRRLVFQLRQRVEPEPREPKYLTTAHGVGYALYSADISAFTSS